MKKKNERRGTPKNHHHARQKPSRNRKRLLFLQGGLVVVLGGIAARVLYLQHAYGPSLLATAAKSENVTRVELAPRGSILDSSGNALAYDVPAYMLDVETASFSGNENELASILSKDLSVSLATATSFVNKSSRWSRWSTPVMEPVREKIQNDLNKINKGSAVTFTPTEQRIYPFDSFAANTIGYVSTTGTTTGLENEYNSQLSGHNGQLTMTMDGYGFPVPSSVKQTKPVQPGDAVETTLDSTIQGYVENEMDNLVNKYHPAHAAIIVTNPSTGAILAISSRPTFNPNEYWKASPEALSTNWAVNTRFEPGSTFKPIVLAAGLATGVVSLNDTFQSGSLTVAGQTIHDWNLAGWGKLTFLQALEDSSNVGFATIAMKLGWANLLHYMNLFGFLQKTGVDLPDEAGPIIFSPSQQGKIQLATSGFGQGNALTPLQQLAAIGVFANGGKLMKPYITKDVIAPDGKVVAATQPTVVRSNFLPQSVISQVNNAMTLDVSKGIDGAAAIPGYQIAGKTGTAQSVNQQTGQYYSDRFITSFIGYAPANDPKVEVYVTVDWPKTAAGNQWGSTIAIPTAKNVMQDCLQYYHVPPSGDASTLSEAKAAASQPTTKYVSVPNVVGLSASDAAKELKKVGLTAAFDTANGVVSKQYPEATVSVPVQSKVYAMIPTGESQMTMPDLTGMTMRDAGNLLTALGLKMQVAGTGFVSSQSVSPGQPVTPLTTVTVTFRDPA